MRTWIRNSFALLALMLAATGLHAQDRYSFNSEGGSYTFEIVPVDPNGPVFIPTPTPASVPTDNIGPQVVQSMEAATQFCAAIIAPEYRVDCLAERLAQIVKTMPRTGDYAEARAALDAASKRLAALARANASTDLPAATFASQGPDGVTTTRPLIPVSTAALDAVNAEALAIIADTTTILLRSSENSARRSAEYTQIAEVMGSNKVLLRSS